MEESPLNEKTKVTFDMNLFKNLVTRKQETKEYIIDIREAREQEVDPTQWTALFNSGMFLLISITDMRTTTEDGKHDMYMSSVFIPNLVDAAQEDLPDKEKQLAEMVFTGVKNLMKDKQFSDVNL